MPASSTLSLPFAPRRILVGASDADAVVAGIRAARPDLEVRGGAYPTLTADDVAWAEVYVGFRRPPVATMGAVRWVQSSGAGVDPWLAPGALEPHILLTRSPQSFGPVIAEWALARVLAFTQRLPALAAAQHAKAWADPGVTRLAGTRALVLGTGDIGAAIARLLGACGVTVTGVSRSGAPVPGFGAVHRTDALSTLVGDADWIILALPDTPATRGLVSRDVLARCRGAVLLNAGRGAAIDEAALPEALDQGWLRGAALDVFVTEPLPTASPLWSDPRVIISPHCSGPTTVDGAVRGFLECLTALERGEWPRWVIDRTKGY